MGQEGCRLLLYEWRLPIHWVCITSTKSCFNYLTNKTNNHWCSINIHLQEIVAMTTILSSCITPAKTLIKKNEVQITFELPDIQNQNIVDCTLMRCRYSNCHGHICNMQLCHLALNFIAGILTAILLSSCTFCLITTLFCNYTYTYQQKYTVQ